MALTLNNLWIVCAFCAGSAILLDGGCAWHGRSGDDGDAGERGNIWSDTNNKHY